MGFEVIYKYHQRLDDGKYNFEEVKEIKKNVGKNYEETPLENLASIIIKQLARRDILIFDVEINEFVKKRVAFKEPVDGKGILLKGKKFFLNNSEELLTEEVESEQETGLILEPHQVNLVNSQLKRADINLVPRTQGALFMVFEPEAPQMPEIKNRKLTVGKKYQILETKTGSLSQYDQVLTLIDDVGRKINISDKYFVPSKVSLIGENEVGGYDVDHGESRLTYSNDLRSVPRSVPEEFKGYPIMGQENIDYSVPDLGRKL